MKIESVIIVNPQGEAVKVSSMRMTIATLKHTMRKDTWIDRFVNWITGRL